MADPWVVTPGERTKHEEQFNGIRPTNGFISGDQAKGFFLQSRLPPPVLGIIWALSDVNGDGKMDLHEFSIACKLINLKLRGFNLPQTLPASLKQSACGGAATSVPGVGASTPQSTATAGTPTASGMYAADLISSGIGAGGAEPLALGCGPSVTPAIAPGPVVSPVVFPGSSLPPAAPISASISVAPPLSSVAASGGPVPQTSMYSMPLTSIPGAIPTSVMPDMGSLGAMINDSGTMPESVAGPGMVPLMSSVPSAPPSVAALGGHIPLTSAFSRPQTSIPGVIPTSIMPGLGASGTLNIVPGTMPVSVTGPTMVPLMSTFSSATRAVPLPGLTGHGVQAPLGGMPVAAPMATAAPIAPTALIRPPVAPVAKPAMPVAPVAQPVMPLAPVAQPAMSVAPMAQPAMSIPPVAQPVPLVPLGQPSMPMVPAASVAATLPMGAAPVVPVQPQMGGVGQIPNVPVASAAPPGVPGAPTASTMQRTGSQESGGSQTPVEWAIPQGSKLKYTQVFNMSDRAKTGFLSGAQARNILIQSQLPQQSLAQIWILSDVDNDGRLSCEEFVLAMYMCECAKAGGKIPTVLPPELIPPTHRRQRTSSVQSGGSGGTPVSDVLAGVLDNSFEDRRRENFEKGQAELERRRKALLDAQRRETEERLRKEREEESKREKARLEAERRRQEELEREMQRQKEVEAQKEQDRKRQEEMREQARKDAETQRQQEWEKQRLQELMNVRQRQQENLLSLKAKNQSLTIELSTKEDRVKELTQKISETRQGVTEVKATIDTMRSTRDTYMTEMNQLKASARDQNQRLLALNQEKARLKARNTAAAGASGAEQAAIDASFTNKQMVIKQLQEKVEELEKELSCKEEDVNNNVTDLNQMKDDMKLTAERCVEIYTEYSTKREEVLRLREKLVNPDAAWGDTPSSAWADPSAEGVALTNATDDAVRYRALYQFDARNADEISFMPGDVITVTVNESTEPGWLGGELCGQTGWFPKDYCELIDDKAVGAGVEETEAVVRTQLENIPEESVTSVTAQPVSHQALGEAVGIFPWRAKQNNHLSFNKGDRITVREQQDQWWYGQLNNTGGWFPRSFVRMVSGPTATTSPVTTPQEAPEEPPMPDNLIHDDISEFYQALYPYLSGEPGDLTFNAGEIILVVKKEGDWWTGIINQNVGIFPSNYVEMIPNQSGKGKKPEIASVIAPYDATSPNQLSLQRGQLVMIRKKTASGWWEGELQAKGKKRQIGWFPATYVKVLGGSSRSTPVSMEITNREDAPPDDVVSPINPNPITQVTISPPTDEPMSGPNDASNGFAEQVEALYPYNAMNDDELTFEAGAIISVIDKEDAAWWKGTIGGLIGVFPSNYVQPYTGVSTVGAVTSPDVEDSLCYREKPVTVSPARGTRESWQISDSSPVEQSRQNVIQEFINTEATYLYELRLVEEAFIKPFRASSVVTEKEIDLMFVNWNELIQANSYFNKALKVRCKNSSGGVIKMIGDVICQQISQLKPYLRFCSIQIRGATLLSEKASAEGEWAELLKQCQDHPAVRGMTLTSFLLKPMQRITKYPLLLKQLLKYTPEGHPDYHNTEEAFTAATTLCAQVNEAVSQRDNTDKLEWMQRQVICEGLSERLVFNSLTNTLGPRKLLHTGVLHKAKSKRELVAFLLSDFLLLTKPSKSVASCSTLASLERALASLSCTMYRKPMFLTDLKVETDKDSELCYTLLSSTCGEIVVSAPTAHERNNWLKKIAIAQKHIQDTDRSLLQRQQSKEKDLSIVGRVLVTVMAGVTMYEKLNEGTLQSFCEVSLGSQVHRTSTATSPHPKWDSTMQFQVKSLTEDVLCITVYDKGYFKPNEFLGRTEIKIYQVYEETKGQPGTQPQLYKLKLEEVNSGEVILKISLQLFDKSL